MGMQVSRPSAEREQELKGSVERLARSAAEALRNADVLLVATGAGFSADSGLATYDDIADVTAYRERGLDYTALCQPHWVHTDAATFYGFWGACFNAYRNASPHEGYVTLRRWRAQRFSPDGAAAAVVSAAWEAAQARKATARAAAMASKASMARENAELQVELDGILRAQAELAHATDVLLRDMLCARTAPAATELAATATAGPAADPWRSTARVETSPSPSTHSPPGAFFAVTSNVDAHFHRAGFTAGEVRQLHGSVEHWQCAHPCTPVTWAAPPHVRFDVDDDTMTAAAAAGSSNRPTCAHCGGPARPAVLMFDDPSWLDEPTDGQRMRYRRPAVYKRSPDSSWMEAVVASAAADPALRVAILEIGCGARVPTVRMLTQALVLQLPRGAATLVRVNPHFPDADVGVGAATGGLASAGNAWSVGMDDQETEDLGGARLAAVWNGSPSAHEAADEEARLREAVVPLMETGLAAMQRLDRLMLQLDAERPLPR